MEEENAGELGYEEPLLDADQRDPYDPPRTEYLYTKLKFFRRLKQDWVQLSPPTKIEQPTHLLPPSHVLPSKGSLYIETQTGKN